MPNQVKIKAAIEALLLTASETITTKEIKQAIGVKTTAIKQSLKELKKDYQAKDKGIELVKLGRGYRLQTKKEYQEFVEKLHKPELNKGLSQAALETLAIIAYKQPVTRAEIEAVRGVNVEKALKTIRKRELIKELGRKDSIGNPIIYGTTDIFLEYMGLNSIQDLPEPEDFSKITDLAEEKRS